jgi:putative ABC transport system substrate-binding protein
MRRREFISLIGGAVATWPLAGRAQETAMPVVAFLRDTAPDVGLATAFRDGLNETGFVEGKNVAIEYQWGGGDRLPAMASELVQRKVNVIATGGLPASLAAKAATSAIPVVFATGDDPVLVGLVTSLNKPGGNVTGISFLLSVLVGKRIELIRELAPSATTIAFLVDPTFPTSESATRDAQAAADALGLRLLVLNASSQGDFQTAFVRIRQHHASALIVNANTLFTSYINQLIALAAQHAVPTIYQLRQAVEAGGLASYGASFADAYRQAGIYAGRILKGEKPSELPVLQPTKFELVINLKTANALGLTVPPALLARADEVIE